MVEQDSPWDDFQRGRMLALELYRRDIHACGLHKSLIDDPENVVLVRDSEVCEVCAALDRHKRIHSEADKAFEKSLGDKPDPKQSRPWDGRNLFLRPATPRELAQRAAERARREPKTRGRRKAVKPGG